MVKKINEFGATVKTLIAAGYSQSWIARKLKTSRQRVNYWVFHPLKTTQKKKRKLPEKYIKKIIDLAENKTTSDMSSTKIAAFINAKLKKDNLNLSIDKSTVCRILKKEYGKPRKVKKVFFLDEKQKQQRVAFCQDIIKKGISGKQILFTDETRIEMGAYTNESIRLSKNNQQKLRKGDKNVFALINRPQKKFELAIMVAGGICANGLTNLIFIDGSENEFAYAQALLYYNDDFQKFKKLGTIYFEQDGATPHTSQSNRNLIEKLFGENKLIQNPPNSPDLAYPIETLWAYIKPRIKRRNPKTLKELKKVTLEEWNSIPQERIKGCGLNYIKRVQKIIEINGERLEEFHLRQIRKEIGEEEGEDEDECKGGQSQEEEEYEDIDEKSSKISINHSKLKLKVIYNDKRLNLLRKKHIAKLRKKIEKIKVKTREKVANIEILKGAPGIVEFRKKKKEEFKKNKKIKIEEIQTKIDEIQEMELIEYLKFTKGGNKKSKDGKKKENNSEESTIEESIDKILKLKEYNKEKDNGIYYEIEF